RLAVHTVGQTDRAIKACGLAIVDPYGPGMPYPRVPAERAIRTDNYRLLAYYDEEMFGGGTAFVYKNPNGSMRHSLEVSESRFYAKTPYGGVVARASRFKTTAGWQFRYYCEGYEVANLERF